jgi:hypothetical protein
MPPFKPTTILKQEFAHGEAHSMDAMAFDEALRSQGVTLVHHRAMLCPQGIIHKDDQVRRVHVDHPGCSNGYLYKKMGTVTAMFTENAASPQFQDIGQIDGSSVQVTFPRTYDLTNERIYVNPFDRFYLFEEDILWPHYEFVEHSIGGRDRLRFPAVKVDHLIDNRMEEYRQDVDFGVDATGQIQWLGARRPGVDQDTEEGRGRVYMAWYLYRPYWYVQRLGKEGRLIQTENEAGERKVVRMPFQAHLVRETSFENEQRNDSPSSPESERAMRGPRDGSFGPR